MSGEPMNLMQSHTCFICELPIPEAGLCDQCQDYQRIGAAIDFVGHTLARHGHEPERVPNPPARAFSEPE